MATKQELEARVEELEKQIASTQAGIPTVASDLTQADLDTKIEQVKTEYESKLSESRDQLAGRTARCLSLEVERDNLRSELDSQTEWARQLFESSTMKSDGANFLGQGYTILALERAVDVIHAWRQKFVLDDDLVLLVKKS